MDTDGQDLGRANHYFVYAVTPGTDSSWYYPTSHVESTGLPQIQSMGSDMNDWNTLASHMGDSSYLVTPLAPLPQTWDTFDQGQTDYQYTENRVVSPLHHTPSITVPQTPITATFQSTEPNLDPWMWDMATPMSNEMYSRRPSHHSDPGYSTLPLSQDSFTRPPFPNTLSRTVSDFIATPSTGIYGSGQSSSPPAGSSSRHRQMIRCFDHGCNGRTFSSISNLRRHQRERAGQSAVCSCPRCGALFYRRWTRDHHVMRMSCLRIPRWSGWFRNHNT